MEQKRTAASRATHHTCTRAHIPSSATLYNAYDFAVAGIPFRDLVTTSLAVVLSTAAVEGAQMRHSTHQRTAHIWMDSFLRACGAQERRRL